MTPFSASAFERGADGNRIKHRIHRDACEAPLFTQRNAEFSWVLEQLGINFRGLCSSPAFFRRAVIADRLKIHGRYSTFGHVGTQASASDGRL